MKMVFTICSNNYLAQAKTLGDSLKQHSPDYMFYIGLVDTLSAEIDYAVEIGYPIILSNEIGIPGFDDLWKKYDIIEFNTCIKPFYFQYFIKKFNTLDYLFYLDPDILIYNDLNIIENEFNNLSGLLLTPHILSPIPLDSKSPGENIFLNYGIFNLGFLGLKKPELSNQFLEWWKERTYHLGFDRIEMGLFVDQLWFNLVPIFFLNVIISKNPGLNMAPWNLHERKLSTDKYIVFLTKTFPLVFYHFSKYNFSELEVLSKNFDRYNFESRQDLTDIYKGYSDLLLKNGVQKMTKIQCHYMELRKEFLENESKTVLIDTNVSLTKRLLKNVIPPAGLRILRRLLYL